MAEIPHVERPVCEYASKRGFHVRKCVWVGRHGCPDRFFFGRGRHFFVEFKDAGKEPEPHQLRDIERMRAQGITVHVIDNVRDGCALFD